MSQAIGQTRWANAYGMALPNVEGYIPGWSHSPALIHSL